MKIFSLILFLTLIGCGDELLDDPTPAEFVDPALVAHLGNFRNEAILHNRPILHEVQVIKFVAKDKLDPGKIGKCKKRKETETWVADGDKLDQLGSYTKTFKWREIWLWEDMEDAPEHILKRLLFHELGHCMLDLKHVDDKEAIMYKDTPTKTTKDEYLDTWSELVENFFDE